MIDTAGPSNGPLRNPLSDVTVYGAGSAERPRPTLWREMVRELIGSRELTWRLFLRDFSVRYRQSLLGYLWAVLPALLTALTFTWLARSHVLSVGGTLLPYPVFVLLNMAVWQLFATGLLGATQSLVGAGPLISKINFPRETLVLAAFGQSLVEFAIRSLLVVAALLFYRCVPAWTIVLAPLAVAPLCLFTVGLGFIAALMNGLFRDMGQLVTLGLTYWMFLTPVVYPAPSAGPGALISSLNPVAPFVTAAQDLAGRGHITHPLAYLVGCMVSLAVFLLGWRVFHLSESRIAERV